MRLQWWFKRLDTWHSQPQKKVDMKSMRTQILPVALCFAISLVLSNKAYIYLSVSYIQVRILLFLNCRWIIFNQYPLLPPPNISADVEGIYSCSSSNFLVLLRTGEDVSDGAVYRRNNLYWGGTYQRRRDILLLDWVYFPVACHCCRVLSPSLDESVDEATEARSTVFPLLHRPNVRPVHHLSVPLLRSGGSTTGPHVHNRIRRYYGSKRLRCVHVECGCSASDQQHVRSRVDLGRHRQRHPPRGTISNCVWLSSHSSAVCGIWSSTTRSEHAQRVQEKSWAGRTTLNWYSLMRNGDTQTARERRQGIKKLTRLILRFIYRRPATLGRYFCSF